MFRNEVLWEVRSPCVFITVYLMAYSSLLLMAYAPTDTGGEVGGLVVCHIGLFRFKCLL